MVMWGNSCTFFMVASITADASAQRAVVRTPGLIAKDSTPLYIPKNRFAGENPARIRSRSKVEGTKWLMCSPKSSSGQRWSRLPRNETTALLGTSISSRPPGFSICFSWQSNSKGALDMLQHIHQSDDIRPARPLGGGLIGKRHGTADISFSLNPLARVDANTPDIETRRDAAVVTIDGLRCQQEQTARASHIHKVDVTLRSHLHDDLQYPLVESDRLNLVGEPIMRGGK